MALNAANTDPSIAEDARAFLRDQRALIADQRHHLHEQFKHLHLSVWEKQLSVLLRVATAVVGIAFAAAVGAMVWDAAHSNGLLIEPFSVPPDLAQRGMTGQVVATKLLDRLVAMQAQTNSARPAKSYTNAWGEHGIKLEIPETGVSLAELNNWLREKLGHDARISGEVVRSAKGLTLTGRTDDARAPGVSGAEEDIDALMDRLAEQIYASTQPFRFGMYLTGKGRTDEALVIFRRLALTGGREDSVWAYPRWGVAVANRDGADAGLRILRQAIKIDPDSIGAYDQTRLIQFDKGLLEQGLQTSRAQLSHLLDGHQTYVAPADVPFRKRFAEAINSFTLGAYGDSLPVWEELSRKPFPGIYPAAGPVQRAIALLFMHDIAAARAALDDVHNLVPDGIPGFDRNFASEESHSLQDWTAALAADTRYLALIRQDFRRASPATPPAALLAQSLAHLGRFAEAQQAIGPTAADCYLCLVARAQIVSLKGESGRADYWFTRAAAVGPSLPFAEYEWGRTLLVRGKPDEAIAKFTIANKKVPHFADPLEGWGEALMAKNQSHLALAKFAEAEKYAPNWGRLHLKWGEALVYSGKKDEAKAQFARAAALDLTQSEKAELARHP
jgi:tetratricopeptide (TPR) repeat protein